MNRIKDLIELANCPSYMMDKNKFDQIHSPEIQKAITLQDSDMLKTVLSNTKHYPDVNQICYPDVSVVTQF